MIKEERQELFNQIYHEYEGMVYRICRRYLLDDYLAEDAMQNTFEAVIRSLDLLALMEQEYVKRYISVIARNQSCNMYKKIKGFSYIPIETLNEIHCMTENDGADQMIRQESLNGLVEAIKRLPQIYADTMLLKYVYQLSSHEISDKLNISQVTVRKRLERGRAKLADLLQLNS